MEAEDISEVTTIEKENFSIPWSEEAFRDSLNSKNTIYVVAVIEDKVIGYCGIYLCPPEGNIVNVAIAKEYRRQHIGKKMLKFLFRKTKEADVTDVILEVRETNVAAIKLYENMGFEEAGIRKNFYEKPTENALIMWKHHL